MRFRTPGFTLVELLVVVTIIVILLALLVPAMDTAIYQAELALCAAQQKTIGTTFQLYTSDNKRSYPTNQERRQSQEWAQPDFLGMESEPTRDLRTVVWPNYLSKLDIFLCPLLGGIDVGYELNNTETRVFGNYLIFAGWNYPNMIGDTPGGGMFRYGDRMEYYDFKMKGPATSRTLLMDNHVRMWEEVRAAKVQSSHPCRDQDLRLKANMNQDVNDVEPGDVNPSAGVIPSFGVPGVGMQLTYSVWIDGNYARMDLNTTGDDLSVQRFTGVEHTDTRFRPAQVHSSYLEDQSVHIYLPN